MNHYVYPYSREAAQNDGDLDLWRQSRTAYIACAHAIEKEITANFDGMHLNKDTAKNVIAEYGYDRVNWVLAATIQQLPWDGRFSHDNKDWAKQYFMDYLKEEIRDYCVRSHPAVLDGFINQTRREWQQLQLFDKNHCAFDSSSQDFSGKVLILNPSILRDECKSPENQLVLATNGFGCDPNASGRKVYGIFLNDGEECQYNRSDFIGIIAEEHIPGWALEKAEDARQMQQSGMLPELEGEQMHGLSME